MKKLLTIIIYIDGEETLAEGVMLGLKSPRYLNEDGSFSGDKYRTLWISYKDNEVGTVYAKENIIFPRINGIWNIKVNEIEKNNKHYDEFICELLNDSKSEESKLVQFNESIYKSIAPIRLITYDVETMYDLCNIRTLCR